MATKNRAGRACAPAVLRCAVLAAAMLPLGVCVSAVRAQEAASAGDAPFFQSLGRIEGLAARAAKKIPRGAAAWDAPAAPGHIIVIPMRLKTAWDGSGDIHVDCVFDGKPYSCLLDTGGGDRIIVPDDSFFRRYPVVGQGSFGSASGTQTPADIIRVLNLSVGGNSLGAADLTRQGARSCRTMSSPIFAGQSVRYQNADYYFGQAGAALILNGPAPGGPFFPLSMRDAHRHMVISVAIGSDASYALFDTGAGMTIIDKDYVAAHPGNFSYADKTWAMDTSCRKLPARFYVAHNISIGGLVFHNFGVLALDLSATRAIADDGRVEMIVGYNIISRANWYFDLAHQRWTVRQIAPLTAPLVWTGAAAAGPVALGSLPFGS